MDMRDRHSSEGCARIFFHGYQRIAVQTFLRVCIDSRESVEENEREMERERERGTRGKEEAMCRNAWNGGIKLKATFSHAFKA